MKSYERVKDMPIGEIEQDRETVHHLICEGSRRHIIYYDSQGMHCTEPRCEINRRRLYN